MIAERHAETFAADLRAGLTRPGQKEIPSKYLWDDVGSALFEAICLLPEYGLARAGVRLLRNHAGEIADRLPPAVLVAELGSGAGRQTRFLLEALAKRRPLTYCPIDISGAALALCRRELDSLPAVHLVGFERAYLDGLAEAAARRHRNERLLVLFLGSTIGNFDRPAAETFLAEVRRLMQVGDYLLLATDLEKPVPALLDAYDDPIGVTAAFNLNVLARANRDLGADFGLANYRHEARWNEGERRIEMHLRADTDHRIAIPRAGLAVDLRAGESIWTESSHRFSCAEVKTLAGRAGFLCLAQWVDGEWAFAHSLLEVRR